MSEPIKVGDLVVVAFKTCCQTDLGSVFRVVALRHDDPERCEDCRAPISPCVCANFAEHPEWWFPVRWLKRIPPLDELEREQEKKELTA